MQFHDLERLPIGESVSLLVSATNPDHDSGRWTKRTPVLVIRSESGWTYVSEHGIHNATAADFPPDSNVGHRGLFAYVAARGARLFEAVEARELVHRAYRSRRRKTVQRARSGARSGAVLAIDLAREDVKAGKVPLHAGPIWEVVAPAGKPFERFRETLRWIEPDRVGLRLVGAANDVSRSVKHTGWYVDGFQSETMHGVVYQLPGSRGRARYLVGHSDPYNGHESGVCLSMAVIESDGSHWDARSPGNLDEIARAADRLAELAAEKSREFSEADQAGQEARTKAREALKAVSGAVAARRRAREAFRLRNATREALRVHGLPEPVLTALRLHDSRVAARDACTAAREAETEARERLDESRRFRDESKPSKWQPELLDAWKEGYANAL